MGHVNLLLLVSIVLLAFFSYRLCTRIMLGKVRSGEKLLALPHHYGLYSVLVFSLPGFCVLLLSVLFSERLLLFFMAHDLHSIVREYDLSDVALAQQLLQLYVSSGSVETVRSSLVIAAEHYSNLRLLLDGAVVGLLACFIGVGFYSVRGRLRGDFAARVRVEFWLTCVIGFASLVAILATFGIVLSLLFESIRFFQQVSLFEFLFGIKWSPQISIRENQVAAGGSFGSIPLFVGTFLITGIAMVVAVPLGLLSAIYLSEYAGSGFRDWVKPLLEVLAGIPTVVYGFFAALTVAPMIKSGGLYLGLDVASESALAAGVVMGIMILPFISSLSDDVISAVPQDMREGSYALGATKSETVLKVLLPSALPGIAGAFLLAVSRAIGETMIVVMASGLVANLTANPLQAVTTVTTQIATLLVGDQEFDNPKTLAAFALGLVLFFVTMVLNMVALWIVRRYREHYE